MRVKLMLQGFASRAGGSGGGPLGPGRPSGACVPADSQHTPSRVPNTMARPRICSGVAALAALQSYVTFKHAANKHVGALRRRGLAHTHWAS